MRVPTLRTALPPVVIAFVMVTGVLANLPLPMWLWWAVPPVELYYSGQYFSSTMAHRNPTSTTAVQWLYKSAPGRADQLAVAADVVAESPGDQQDFWIPMHLSSAARSAGWTYLVRGPRVQYKAAELEPYLRDQFYDGRSFWRLLEPAFRWGLFVLFALLAVREWFVGRARERRLRRQEVWSESFRNRDHGWRVVTRPFPWSWQLLKRGADAVADLIRKGMPKRATSSDVPETGTKLQRPPQLSPVTAPEKHTEAAPRGGPNVFPIVGAEQPDTHSQSETPTAPPSPPRKPVKRHSIFPGKARQKAADDQPASWDESQWID
jgi:hypothetical protein